ncbi:hypothetical protein [Psittacicella hinzii]|uniref:Uncharacterized protein n=1 Tax=Psittacicella hinzii TaxID=2028575 RepID=A0A3A1YMA7_9GAMM|nr:hypothetical protein [Psittacicella hinzii]RIY39302.1 hypothetical protein CKF58_02355 [Psittacicella hinzii]
MVGISGDLTYAQKLRLQFSEQRKQRFALDQNYSAVQCEIDLNEIFERAGKELEEYILGVKRLADVFAGQGVGGQATLEVKTPVAREIYKDLTLVTLDGKSYFSSENLNRLLKICYYTQRLNSEANRVRDQELLAKANLLCQPFVDYGVNPDEYLALLLYLVHLESKNDRLPDPEQEAALTLLEQVVNQYMLQEISYVQLSQYLLLTPQELRELPKFK